MPRLTLTDQPTTNLNVDALVVGVGKVGELPVIVGDALPNAYARELETVAKELAISGELDDLHRIAAGPDLQAKIVVLTGIGAERDGGYPPENLRRAVGAAMRRIAGLNSAAIALPVGSDAQFRAVVEGALLGDYGHTIFLSSENAAKRTPVPEIQIVAPEADSARLRAITDRAMIVSEAVNATRDLVNTPPNLLYPQTLAAAAEAAVGAVGGAHLSVTVLDTEKLIVGGYGGLVGVGQGSARGPYLVKVAYLPPGTTAKPIGLIGKGITFDTGGISLKRGGDVHLMTSDMAGAASVLHAVIAASRLRLRNPVTAYLCLAENMPGGNAQRPGDVITIRGGKTVEVTNTDAEGRLVMADGLVAAIEDSCATLVDIATLTGAQVTALGHRTGGVMGTDQVRDELVAAAEIAGESFWAMPLPDELPAGLKSHIADLNNCPADHAANMMVAAQFLREFTADVPWGHLDIAGPAYNDIKAYGYTPMGATGMGVRTLIEFLAARSGA